MIIGIREFAVSHREPPSGSSSMRWEVAFQMSIKYSGMMSYLIHSQATREPPHLEFGVEPPASACLMSHQVAPSGSLQTLYYQRELVLMNECIFKAIGYVNDEEKKMRENQIRVGI
jgi:hypothetical protein